MMAPVTIQHRLRNPALDYQGCYVGAAGVGRQHGQARRRGELGVDGP